MVLAPPIAPGLGLQFSPSNRNFGPPGHHDWHVTRSQAVTMYSKAVGGESDTIATGPEPGGLDASIGVPISLSPGKKAASKRPGLPVGFPIT